MFTEKRAMFIYCASPVHMGAGTSLGVIDNPIQRERHTDHPVMAGSGIKGAMRHEANGNGMGKDMVNKIFGPDAGNSADHAGAVSFSDGQIVLFPIRCLKEGFVYATCPTALGRLARLLEAAGVKHEIALTLTNVKKDECATASDDVLAAGGKLVLEAYEYANQPARRDDVKKTAKWLADNAVNASGWFSFFKEKIEKHVVVLNDGEFAFFVKNATVVEPHVRIDDASGTAASGGLFFTENLPPESLLVSLAMASAERKKKGSGDKDIKAPDIIAEVVKGFNNEMLQIGGDATTGRGQVFIRFAGGEK